VFCPQLITTDPVPGNHGRHIIVTGKKYLVTYWLSSNVDQNVDAYEKKTKEDVCQQGKLAE